MLLLATCLLGAFIIGSISRDDGDDDDRGTGMMIPASNPV